MMENREYLNRLLDIYGELLTDLEKETFGNYYREDLTINEIAEERGVTKASVSKMINQVLKKLKFYEERLRILEMKQKIDKILEIDDLEKIKKEIRNLLD